jgi:hypothetical protein
MEHSRRVKESKKQRREQERRAKEEKNANRQPADDKDKPAG